MRRSFKGATITLINLGVNSSRDFSLVQSAPKWLNASLGEHMGPRVRSECGIFAFRTCFDREPQQSHIQDD